jgi:hypothetical protein
MWHAQGDQGKSVWKVKARQVKEHHKKMYPDYSYKPRKPSEKKRRMTKRKAAALQKQLVGSPFALDPDNPMMAQHPLDSSEAGKATFDAMVDQHNSGLVVNYDDLDIYTTSWTPIASAPQVAEANGVIAVDNSVGDGGFPGQFSLDQEYDFATSIAELERQASITFEDLDAELFGFI